MKRCLNEYGQIRCPWLMRAYLMTHPSFIALFEMMVHQLENCVEQGSSSHISSSHHALDVVPPLTLIYRTI